jgi:hypothetical protein
MKILLGNFSAKVGEEEILKPRTGSKILHDISNNNRIVVIATSKNLIIRRTMFSYNNIHKFT